MNQHQPSENSLATHTRARAQFWQSERQPRYARGLTSGNFHVALLLDNTWPCIGLPPAEKGAVLFCVQRAHTHLRTTASSHALAVAAVKIRTISCADSILDTPASSLVVSARAPPRVWVAGTAAAPAASPHTAAISQHNLYQHHRREKNTPTLESSWRATERPSSRVL